MLIKSLNAKNFRKYYKLEVSDIPEKGLITVAGLNESGKTSIGEAICFALFGRTFVLDEKNLHKIICWGRDVAEVTLGFISGSGERYTLYRSIDREGAGKVELKKEIAEGISDHVQISLDTDEAVANALSKILGFNYDSFANSFYLAQRELTTPDPHSETIKQMAGIGEYARISNELAASNQENSEKIAETNPQVESTQADLDAINLDEEWLPELIDAEQTLGVEKQRREALLQHMTNNEQLYAENAESYKSASKKRGFFSFLSFLMLPVIIISWLLWALNRFYPDTLNSFLSSFSVDEGVTSQIGTWALPIALIGMLIFILSQIVKRNAIAKLSHLDAEAEEFSVSMREGHRFVTTEVETLLPERVVQLLQTRKEEQSTLLVIPPREQFTNLSQLIEDTAGYKADAEEISAAKTRLSDALISQDAEIIDLSTGLVDDIDKEKIRSDKAGKIRTALKALTTIVNDCQHTIDVQNISIGLLQRAAKDSIELFNKNIAEISAKTLPSFTEGRYSEVRIGEDLSVQVYSDEKKGYMDFDETSSGTQRQIMLALRMAMSEELSKNSGNEQQFIFLDEPFAFFDQARTKSTLTALPDVSKVITQVWVVAQEFPADVKVDKAINCPLDSAELLV